MTLLRWKNAVVADCENREAAKAKAEELVERWLDESGLAIKRKGK